MSAEDTVTVPTVVIRPSQGRLSVALRAIFEYHELLYFFVWRDIKVRYRQTVLGAAWAVIQPIFTMIVFALIFGQLAKLPSDGVPYPVFAFAALVPWYLFSNGVAKAASSIVVASNLVTKVHFPRLLIPIAACISVLVDFGISFAVLLVMMVYFGVAPTIGVIAIPLALLLCIATALGIGLWLAALNAEYRDIGHAVPFLLQFLLFATPVAYPTTLVPASWQWVYSLNPMVTVVETFRWALLSTAPPFASITLPSIGVALVLLVSGLLYFHRTERRFADVV